LGDLSIGGRCNEKGRTPKASGGKEEVGVGVARKRMLSPYNKKKKIRTGGRVHVPAQEGHVAEKTKRALHVGRCDHCQKRERTPAHRREKGGAGGSVEGGVRRTLAE